VANDPGTDGTVRWSGCGLNTRKITIDLTRFPKDEDGKPASQRLSDYRNDVRHVSEYDWMFGPQDGSTSSLAAKGTLTSQN
jgi:hypothetical protein